MHIYKYTYKTIYEYVNTYTWIVTDLHTDAIPSAGSLTNVWMRNEHKPRSLDDMNYVNISHQSKLDWNIESLQQKQIKMEIQFEKVRGGEQLQIVLGTPLAHRSDIPCTLAGHISIHIW